MQDLSARRGAHEGARYLDLARWLEVEMARTVRAIAPDQEIVIAIEDVRSHVQRNKEKGTQHFATTAAHVYGGLRAVIGAWACARRFRLLPLGVGTWKATLGCQGGSHATKDEVMRCVRMMGLRPTSQDEADAIGVAFAADRALVWEAKVGVAPVARKKTQKKNAAQKERSPERTHLATRQKK